jgi:iron complex outermembrane receptor protein
MKKHLQMMALLGLLVCWGLMLAGQVALAEEIALLFGENLEEELLFFPEEDLVVGASKYKQSVREAPAAVTIISARDIEQYGWRDLADVLRSVRGFYVTNDRNYKYAGVRGFGPVGDYNNKILLLLNGHRVNEGFSFTAGIENTVPIDLDNIKKIEIIRGPGSALYGASAVFAVINVITKTGKELDGFKVSYEAGSFERNKGILSFGKRLDNGMDFYLSVSAEEMGGQVLHYEEFDNPATNNGYTEKNRDEETTYHFYGSLSLGGFTLQGAGYTREKHIPTAPWETIFNDPDGQSIDEQWFVDAKYEHKFNDTDLIVLRAYHDYYHYEGDYWYKTSDWGEPYGDRTNYPDYNNSSYYGTELQFNWQPFEDKPNTTTTMKLTRGAGTKPWVNTILRMSTTMTPGRFISRMSSSCGIS